MRKVLMLMLGLFVLCTSVLAQKAVSGTVTDENGQPVPGASVIVKGSRTGTVTASNGEFSLTVPNNAKTLVISGVGFATQEVAIGTRTSIPVSLKQDTRSLEQVVVTGYTREKKQTFVGSATVLSSKAVENVPVASFDQMLQGRVPGLLSNSGSGQPGATANVRIRGTSSLAGQGQPLYIVDGIPLNSGDLATMNPNDFESITVLKDASAAALYGARGGLGVIVITTKSARAGQPTIGFRTQYGMTQRPQPSQFTQMNSRQMLDYEEFVGLHNNGLVAPGWEYSKKNPKYNTLQAGFTTLAQQQARYDFLRDSFGKNTVDYYDVLFRTGTQLTNEVSMQGGTSANRYLMSLNNFQQEGTDRKSKLNRYTLRLNLDNTFGKLTTKLTSLLGYSKTDYNEGSFYAGNGTANPFAMVWRAKPYENPYNALGKPITGTSSSLNPRAIGNLIDRSDNSTWIDKQLKANAGLTVAFKVLPFLTLANRVGVDGSMSYGQGYISANSYTGTLQAYQAGYLNESNYNRVQLVNTSSAIFNKKLSEMHELDLGAYFETVRTWNNGMGFSIYNLDPRLSQTGQGAGTLLTNGAATMAQNGSSAKSGYGIRSYFGTARYTYNNRYTLTGNIRRDGTSRIINPDNREITTYSFGAVWDAIKESFLANQNIFSNLRIRASYGRVPNINSIPGGSFGLGSNFYSVTRYISQQEPAFSAVGFAGSTITASAPGAFNPNLRIENIAKSNIGFDFGFMKNRVNLSVELYRNLTKDLFVSQQQVATSGFYGTGVAINAGEMSNKGVEADLTVDVLRTTNIDVTFRANHAYNKNKIEDLGLVSEYVSGTAIVRKGLPVGSHYSYSYLGSDPATGRPVYKRLNGTPTTNINEAGQFAEFGSHLPVHTGGFSATFRFKRLSIEPVFTYQWDVRRYNNVQNWVTQGDLTYTGAVTQSASMFQEQWQKPGDVRLLQSPSYSRQFTSVDISDASFLRFRNLNISYNIPELKIGNTRLTKSARFYVQGQNIAIWSPWSGLDPEDDNNISLAEFPNARAFVIGLDFNF